MAYSTPTAEPVSPKVDLAIEQQLQEANVYISQMKRYLHTNKKNELYPRCAAFIRWVIQEGEVPYGYSIKDLTLGVFYFRWNIKTLDPVLMAEYFDGTTDVAIRESAATWMVLYDEFWQHYVRFLAPRFPTQKFQLRSILWIETMPLIGSLHMSNIYISVNAVIWCRHWTSSTRRNTTQCAGRVNRKEAASCWVTKDL